MMVLNLQNMVRIRFAQRDGVEICPIFGQVVYGFYMHLILECIYSGYVLETSVVSRAIQTRSKEDCARQCHVLGFCKTFAYSP